MNTTALRTPSAFAPARGTAAGTLSAAGVLRATARDFVASILSVTKAGLLEQQPVRARLRRF